MSGFAMLSVLLVVGAAVVWFVRRQGSERRRQARADLHAQVVAARRVAEEDVTRFGEELEKLGVAAADHPHDTLLNQDFARARTARDEARATLVSVAEPHEIKKVTQRLEDGRCALAQVMARLAGRPLPARRPPCFFNPGHGPSVTNVSWGPADGSPRDVPACAADAERVLAGADPYIRTVPIGERRVPYWDGGPAYAPYAQGYYAGWRGSALLSGVLAGTVILGGTTAVFGDDDAFDMEAAGFDGVGEGVGDMFSEPYDVRD
ncbi:hypothetical protein [Mariniluteicoccus flavus]